MKKIIFEKYESAAQFCAAMEAKKPNPKNIRPGGRASRLTGEEETKWAGTETFEDAQKLLKFGYLKGLEGIRQERLKLEQKDQTEGQRPRLYNDFSGFKVDVPAYLAGIPQNMINATPRKKTVPVIKIYISLCICRGRNEAYFYKAGANILTLVKAIETQGANVEILGVSYYNDSAKGIQAVNQIKLKAAGEKLNPLRLSFPLCHPSFFRRLIFDWLEKLPIKIDVHTYGREADLADINAAMQLKPNEILIDANVAQDYNKLVELVQATNAI